MINQEDFVNLLNISVKEKGVPVSFLTENEAHLISFYSEPTIDFPFQTQISRVEWAENPHICWVTLFMAPSTDQLAEMPDNMLSLVQQCLKEALGINSGEAIHYGPNSLHAFTEFASNLEKLQRAYEEWRFRYVQSGWV